MNQGEKVGTRTAICLPNWGACPHLGATRCLPVRTRCLHTYIYYLEFLIDFSALHAPFNEIDMVNCTLE